MKDVTLEVRTAVVQKLQGEILYNGQPVPVRGGRVNTTIIPPYIYVPTQSSLSNSGKDYFSTDHTVTVEVVFRSETGTEQNVVDDLANQVCEVLAPMRQIDMPQPETLGMVDFTLTSINQLVDYDDTYTYLRKILVFETLVDEG